MAFLLTVIDKRAMRLNGRMTLGGVAVSSGRGELVPGRYRACRSGVGVELVVAGGRVLPDESAREAYSASLPTPVAIDAAALDVPEIRSEVFLKEDELRVLHEFETAKAAFPESFVGHWIPVEAIRAGACVGDGWVMQVDKDAKVILLLEPGVDTIESLQLSPLYAPRFEFCIP